MRRAYTRSFPAKLAKSGLHFACRSGNSLQPNGDFAHLSLGVRESPQQRFFPGGTGFRKKFFPTATMENPLSNHKLATRPEHATRSETAHARKEVQEDQWTDG